MEPVLQILTRTLTNDERNPLNSCRDETCGQTDGQESQCMLIMVSSFMTAEVNGIDITAAYTVDQVRLLFNEYEGSLPCQGVVL